MKIDTAARTERRRQVQQRVNRTHIRALLAGMRSDGDEIPEPRDARRMRPHIFGEEVTR